MIEINIKLQNFDGPMDLLLYLIGKSQINIKEIFISEITQQYIESVQNADDIDMESMGDFLAMAARLIEIKSKSILPKSLIEEDIEEEKIQLIMQIEEYKLYKDLSIKLAELETISFKSYTKLPEEFPLPPQEFELTENKLESINSAIIRIIERKIVKKEKEAHRNRIREVSKENITIKQSIYIILKNISNKAINLYDIDDFTCDKEHLVTYFIAILELLKLGKINASQNGIFKNIKIQKKVRNNEQ